MRILLTGITGGIGARLAPRLLADGHEVRGMTRRVPTEGSAHTNSAHGIPAGAELVQGDAVSGAGLEQAFDGVEIAYYLIHSMEPSANGPFEARERAAAENFVRAARRAGVERLVYLGGLVPPRATASRHLASRVEVERLLLDGAPDSVAFRASIVIGARSRSFRFLVRLVERLPVLVVPAWRTHRTAPIDERDVVEYLARAAEGGPASDALSGASLDVAGPDVVTYGELIGRIRDEMLVSRPCLGLRHLTLTPIASRVSALVAGEEPELIEPLMESLDSDLLPRDARVTELLPLRRHTLHAAIERALRDWEQVEPLRAR